MKKPALVAVLLSLTSVWAQAGAPAADLCRSLTDAARDVADGFEAAQDPTLGEPAAGTGGAVDLTGVAFTREGSDLLVAIHVADVEARGRHGADVSEIRLALSVDSQPFDVVARRTESGWTFGAGSNGQVDAIDDLLNIRVGGVLTAEPTAVHLVNAYGVEHREVAPGLMLYRTAYDALGDGGIEVPLDGPCAVPVPTDVTSAAPCPVMSDPAEAGGGPDLRSASIGGDGSNLQVMIETASELAPSIPTGARQYTMEYTVDSGRFLTSAVVDASGWRFWHVRWGSGAFETVTGSASGTTVSIWLPFGSVPGVSVGEEIDPLDLRVIEQPVPVVSNWDVIGVNQDPFDGMRRRRSLAARCESVNG